MGYAVPRVGRGRSRPFRRPGTAAEVAPEVKAVTYRISSLAVFGSTVNLRMLGAATLGILVGALAHVQVAVTCRPA
jgi:hypothetical protein